VGRSDEAREEVKPKERAVPFVSGAAGGELV